MLLTYYLFLVAGLLLMTTSTGRSLLLEPRSAHMAYLLGPPFVLLVSLFNFGFVGTVIVTVLLILASKVLLKRYAAAGVTRATLYYSLSLSLLEALVPLSVHFALRSRPDTERWSLMITAVILVLAPILVLAVWAPDVSKKA